MDVDLELRLVSGKPIPFQHLFLHQLTLSEIIDIGWNEFDKMCVPYAINKEYIGIPDEEKFSNIRVFDLFFQKDFKINNELVLEMFINSCRAFFRTNNIKIDIDESMKYPQINIENGKVIINRNNFNELQDLIMKIYNLKLLEKPVEEKKYKNKRYASVQAHLLKGRNETKKYKSNEICMIYRYVTVEQNYIDYEKVLNMTVYQLTNTYSLLLKKENYQTGIQFRAAALAQGAELDEFPHWIIEE